MLHIFVFDLGVEHFAQESGVLVELVVQARFHRFNQLVFNKRIKGMIVLYTDLHSRLETVVGSKLIWTFLEVEVGGMVVLEMVLLEVVIVMDEVVDDGLMSLHLNFLQ